MRDIGKHPDSGNPIEREHEYETKTSYELICPWCNEDIELDHDLEGMFWMALDETHDKQECWNCYAALTIYYLFVELAGDYTARVDIEVEGTKRIA